MTAVREAFVLPFIFTTVAALGGLRIAERVQFVAPPLTSLVVGVVLIAALVRSALLAPDRLMNVRRSALENLNGFVVLLTLFAASTQVFTLVIPDSGLLHAVFGLALFVQLVTTFAGIREPRALLRSLAILLGSAFVLRYLVLDTLYAPHGSWGQRVLVALVEGVSLGAVAYQPTGTITGYVAFAALVLYLAGLTMLPRGTPAHGDIRGELAPTSRELLVIVLSIGIAASAGCSAGNGAGDPSGGGERVRVREDALTRARVWRQPAVPIAEFDFTANPSGEFAVTDDVACEFTVQKLSGRTPKFHCRLPDGRILKVKYGSYNGELQAELAGTRVLRALGFPADDMFVVRSVRCAGCPPYPFEALLCNEKIGVDLLCFAGAMDPSRVRAMRPVAIERRIPGTVIEADDDQGWSWFELDRIDPSRGGSSRAEVDALRLLAVVLGHWDNKGPNQRLLCPEGKELADGSCSAPLAMIQDLGATFGPERVDLLNWREVPVWQDRATCTISMRSLPFGGATFVDRRISEEGRTLLAGLLEQLSDRQLADLFTAARFAELDGISAEAGNPRAWVRVFQEKIKAVKEGGPCG
jgi:hypothetical protein